MQNEITNDTPLEHMCANGTIFRSENADLRTGVEYKVQQGMDDEAIAHDFYEFGAWHQYAIWPELNGFQGVGSVRFTKTS